MAESPLVCSEKAQCDRYWQRAQVWLAQNSRWRIQTANDVLIQTYGPGNSSTDVAYTVIRASRIGGGAEISVRAACDNIFGCFPDTTRAKASLKEFMRSAQ